jgi:hypothetical protein
VDFANIRAYFSDTVWSNKPLDNVLLGDGQLLGQTQILRYLIRLLKHEPESLLVVRSSGKGDPTDQSLA